MNCSLSVAKHKSFGSTLNDLDLFFFYPRRKLNSSFKLQEPIGNVHHITKVTAWARVTTHAGKTEETLSPEGV